MSCWPRGVFANLRACCAAMKRRAARDIFGMSENLPHSAWLHRPVSTFATSAAIAMFTPESVGWLLRTALHRIVREALRGDAAESAGLIVLEGLDDLELGVHDERAVGDDGLADRPAAEEQDVEVGAAALLAGVSGDGDRVATAEHRELSAFDRPTLRPDSTLAA